MEDPSLPVRASREICGCLPTDELEPYPEDEKEGHGGFQAQAGAVLRCHWAQKLAPRQAGSSGSVGERGGAASAVALGAGRLLLSR